MTSFMRTETLKLGFRVNVRILGVEVRIIQFTLVRVKASEVVVRVRVKASEVVVRVRVLGS